VLRPVGERSADQLAPDLRPRPPSLEGSLAGDHATGEGRPTGRTVTGEALHAAFSAAIPDCGPSVAHEHIRIELWIRVARNPVRGEAVKLDNAAVAADRRTKPSGWGNVRS